MRKFVHLGNVNRDNGKSDFRTGNKLVENTEQFP